uniref:Rad21/Rec8-like protein N-terminal domain-containing protein n=2 Tax=Hemiselmis andersenii TaxID=464988 RepID=A0A6U5CJ50_HEMAN|mmetsp:Transcript_6313/g.15263  ORF Transcript_6313/g.15263 Transcript_6313/m.15263 type:complete len:609 (+) Transcript_6313:85-1911(+)
MFYVADLNLKGKGPLARMWQACFSPGKISKKVIQTFNTIEGCEAILNPAEDMVYSLRLNSNLMFGLVRLHGMKVNLLDDNLKSAHDKITIRFNPNTTSVDLDMSRGARGKSESKRSEELQMSIADFDMMLDIPDEVPSYLKSEEWELSQARSDGFPSASPGGISAIASSRNRSSSMINLPDAYHSGSGLGTDQDERMYSDVLEVPGEMPEELAAYEDFNYSGRSASASRDMSSAGHNQDDYDVVHDDGMMQIDEVNYDDEMAGKPGKSKRGAAERPAKRPRKIGKIQMETQISKDEYRKWVTDNDWVKAHICKPRRHLGSVKEVSIVKRVSMPVSGGFGRRLTKLFTETLAYSEKATPKKKKKSAGPAGSKVEAGDAEREEDVFDNPPDYGDDYGGYDGYDGGDVGYGAGSSDAGGSSVLREDPERMRAGSEERRASRESQGLNADQRGSADRMSLPSFDFQTQTPQGSVMSGSMASSRGRMDSIGEIFDPLSFDHDDEESEGTLKRKEKGMLEEPESVDPTRSQTNLSQRLSENSILFAREIAKKIPNEGDELSFNRLTRHLDDRRAARCFYSMLLLVSENIVEADQRDAYGDITMTATSITQIYCN